MNILFWLFQTLLSRSANMHLHSNNNKIWILSFAVPRGCHRHYYKTLISLCLICFWRFFSEKLFWKFYSTIYNISCIFWKVCFRKLVVWHRFWKSYFRNIILESSFLNTSYIFQKSCSRSFIPEILLWKFCSKNFKKLVQEDLWNRYFESYHYKKVEWLF